MSVPNHNTTTSRAHGFHWSQDVDRGCSEVERLERRVCHLNISHASNKCINTSNSLRWRALNSRRSTQACCSPACCTLACCTLTCCTLACCSRRCTSHLFFFLLLLLLVFFVVVSEVRFL